MTIDRQPRVSLEIPCRLSSVSGKGGKCVLDLGISRISLPMGGSLRLLRRIAEAKRKACGRFVLSFAFPARDASLEEIGRLEAASAVRFGPFSRRSRSVSRPASSSSGRGSRRRTPTPATSRTSSRKDATGRGS